MSSRYTTKNGRTSKRGTFLNGIWHCDCEPRLPADKFQTKNGGKNHGRWFYTCQMPQPKRCSFFLWSDEAKVREESAVLNNSRSEPVAQPQTPRKMASPVLQAPTPTTGNKNTRNDCATVAVLDLEHKDSFEWSSSAEEELAAIADRVPEASTTCETPRKAVRTEAFNSPGKRTHTEMTKSSDTWPLTETVSHDDVFATPSTSNKSHGLLSPIITPTYPQGRSQPHALLPPADPSKLAQDVLKALEPVQLPNRVEFELVELLNSYDLRTQGISKGREIARLAIRAKERKITELQARIQELESEKERPIGYSFHI